VEQEEYLLVSTEIVLNSEYNSKNEASTSFSSLPTYISSYLIPLPLLLTLSPINLSL